jgi:hypothetical protein
MTRLRPLVIPAAALTLAVGVPSATAQPRSPVSTWAEPPTALAAAHADLGLHASLFQPATPLPLAVLEVPREAAVPDGRYAVAASPASVAAAGRPLPYGARDPP